MRGTTKPFLHAARARLSLAYSTLAEYLILEIAESDYGFMDNTFRYMSAVE